MRAYFGADSDLSSALIAACFRALPSLFSGCFDLGQVGPFVWCATRIPHKGLSDSGDIVEIDRTN